MATDSRLLMVEINNHSDYCKSCGCKDEWVLERSKSAAGMSAVCRKFERPDADWVVGRLVEVCEVDQIVAASVDRAPHSNPSLSRVKHFQSAHCGNKDTVAYYKHRLPYPNLLTMDAR
jgi:hypothetical protein